MQAQGHQYQRAVPAHQDCNNVSHCSQVSARFLGYYDNARHFLKNCYKVPDVATTLFFKDAFQSLVLIFSFAYKIKCNLILHQVQNKTKKKKLENYRTREAETP